MLNDKLEVALVSFKIFSLYYKRYLIFLLRFKIIDLIYENTITKHRIWVDIKKIDDGHFKPFASRFLYKLIDLLNSFNALEKLHYEAGKCVHVLTLVILLINIAVLVIVRFNDWVWVA